MIQDRVKGEEFVESGVEIFEDRKWETGSQGHDSRDRVVDRSYPLLRRPLGEDEFDIRVLGIGLKKIRPRIRRDLDQALARIIQK